MPTDTYPHGNQNLTTAAILATSGLVPPEASADVIQEFCRPADFPRLFSLSRSTAYELIANGSIRSVVLRKKGRTTGARLIDVRSVKSYLNSLAE